MTALYPPKGAALTDYRGELRHIPTVDLLADQEFYAWELADLDQDPLAHHKTKSLAFVRFKLGEIMLELARRETLKRSPHAPPWPLPPAADRAQWDAVKAHYDLRDTIERMGGVTFSGPRTALKCRCPFGWHDDRTPSFTLYPDHFHCYGCGVGGSVIDFVAAFDGLTPREAVNQLAATMAPPIIVHRREEPTAS